MTYSESLSRIKRNVNPTFWSKEDIEHYNNIVNALEKQLPKKPKTDQYGYYVCPSCGADDYALMHDSNIANQYNRCHNCGQAIDWGDKE